MTAGIRSTCLGNVMRVDVGPLGEKRLEVALTFNNSVYPLTPRLESQCGFSTKRDQLGNTIIYASLQNCFAWNVADSSFTTSLQLRLHGSKDEEEEVYQVSETCHYQTWAAREIICGPNFMEVSMERTVAEDSTLHNADHRRTVEKVLLDSEYKLSKVVFYTPAERIMKLEDAQQLGYGIGNTPSRLVLRSPLSTHETYTQNVAGVRMNVLLMSAVYRKKWLTTQIDATAVCPVAEGSVTFTPNFITWYLPRHIDPLISSDQFTLMEVHMGVDGEILDSTELENRRYSLSVNDIHIIVEIPVGAVGGFFKSLVQDGQYLSTYSIEPMLELLWVEEFTQDQTRYKVMMPITTPVMSRPPQVIDNTIPQERMFKVLIGPFGLDAVLMNVSFPGEVLSLTDCQMRGFDVQELPSQNGSKVFSIQVPFSDRVVHLRGEAEASVYTLQLALGLLVLPELTPFTHFVHLEARVVDVGPPATVAPSATGHCDYKSFILLVKYGSDGFNFNARVGQSLLTVSKAQEYGLLQNGTHFSLVVPFAADDVVFEAVDEWSIRTRLDLTLSHPETGKTLNSFSLACNFRSSLAECLSNGTMTALAIKVESVPSLDPRQLTLSDPSCGPTYSDDRHAYFVFTGDSCGTTRKFLSNAMVYENEISLPDHMMEREKQEGEMEEPEYELKISCYYDITSRQAVPLHTRPRRSEPYADNAQGDLDVEMRLSSDDSYKLYYRAEDFPLVVYLQQPLYFEVELMKSTNPAVSLELESCWATTNRDRLSPPRWDLIINGCANPAEPFQVTFHPVEANDKIQFASNMKRFEVLMSAYSIDMLTVSLLQLFVHCDVLICDPRNPLNEACSSPCSNKSRDNGEVSTVT
ncbi:zona pellucida sperm-binding protein 2-like [Synchiropus splendidus]|uniref:zona pellucida sperm-binding protein 2-like n=1 Tax=Synchiropus splendidus TaxID=270530 RepID=UPI00237D7420|nr:zona pellucida sperm-binding protein 2-like [Synchiropus splendidus]